MAAVEPVPQSDAVPLLQLLDVSAGYGPFRALFSVSFEILAGNVLALLGSNGAGKTTVARVCSGLVAPTSGTVWFDGEDVTGDRPYKYARHGVVHAPEGRSVFASLTVEENLSLTFRRSRGKAGEKTGLEEAYTMFPRLRERRRQVAGTLSGGEQRMLSLSRVMVEKPRLLIADELSLGLAPIIVDEVYATLATDPRVGHDAAHRGAARPSCARDCRRGDRAREGRSCVLGSGERTRRSAGARARRRAVRVLVRVGAEQARVHDAGERVDHRVVRRRVPGATARSSASVRASRRARAMRSSDRRRAGATSAMRCDSTRVNCASTSVPSRPNSLPPISASVQAPDHGPVLRRRARTARRSTCGAPPALRVPVRAARAVSAWACIASATSAASARNSSSLLEK